MSFYDTHILPRVIDCGCGGRAFADQRRRVVPEARGTVLDLGAGTGLNLPFYDPARVARVIGLDPCARSLELAAQVKTPVPFEPLVAKGEAIPLPDGSVDTVVLTYTLCTVDDPAAVLAEVGRVLSSEGRILFCEHVAAPTRGIGRLQGWIARPWAALFGGCRLDRRAGGSLRRAGFRVVAETLRVPRLPAPVAWQTVGHAWPLAPGERSDRFPTDAELCLSI